MTVKLLFKQHVEMLVSIFVLKTVIFPINIISIRLQYSTKLGDGSAVTKKP